MSPQSGKCVVCGKECRTRCGPCSSKGLDWMYFCSTSCQKFIWFTHKKFCGKDKLEWPSLDKEGRRRVAEISQKNWCETESSSSVESQIPFGAFFSQDLTYFESLDSKARSQISQSALSVLYDPRFRTTKSLSSLPENDQKSAWANLQADPIGALAHFQLHKSNGRPVEIETPYLRNLQHRLLNLFTVMSTVQFEVDSERACFEHAFHEAKAVLLQAEEPDRAFTRRILAGLHAFRSKMRIEGRPLNL